MQAQDRCPRCHEVSTTQDACSECGASMVVQSIQPVPPVQPSLGTSSSPATQDAGLPVTLHTCPVCNEPRGKAQGRYCETCRYDFVLRLPFGGTTVPGPVMDTAPVGTLVSPDARDAPDMRDAQDGVLAQVPSSSTVTAADTGYVVPSVRWELTAVADPALCQPSDVVPSDLRPRLFPVVFEENLVGRKSGSDVQPELALPDAGVSKRHARINLRNGVLTIMDLGSTNGTILNGIVLEPHVEASMQDGDELLVGVCTRIRVSRH